MNRFYRLIIVFFVIGIGFTGTIVPIHADNSIKIVDSSIDIHFPGALAFKIQASSSSDIVDVRLSYIVDRMNFARVINEAWPDFVPSTDIDTSWTWDTRKGRLPPGAEIQYWWLVKNRDGEEASTEVKTVIFTDNTHTWKEIKSGNLKILWYQGEDKFANELMTSATDSLERLTRDTGAMLKEPIQIFIYGSSEDLQQSMVSPREWTGGVAFTEYSIIAIGIEPANLDWGKNALAHELGHAAVHQITYSPFSINLPTWLDEGLAQHAEITKNDYLELLLKNAAENNTLISLRSLCSPFSAIPQQAYLSYAESLSVVDYLIQEYGATKILSLLKAFKEGSTYDDALQKVYGFDMEELESRWIIALNEKYAQNKQYAPAGITGNKIKFQDAINLFTVPLISLTPAISTH